MFHFIKRTYIFARLTVPAHDINDISHKDDAGYHTPENVLR